MGETEDYDKSATPTAHASTHQDGGSDEVSVAALSGQLADAQPSTWTLVSGKPTTFAPAAHKTSHQDGGSDEISVQGLAGTLADPQTPAAHKTSHQDGGSDEISATGLSGELTDLQKPKDHTHQSSGSGVGGKIDHGAALDGLTDDDHTQYIKHALATAESDFLVASGSGAYVKKTLAETKTILGVGGVDSAPAKAYMSVDQIIGGQTYTKVQFDTERFDVGGNYDTTNYRYVVPTGAAGKYFVTATIRTDSWANQFNFILIYVNGVAKSGYNLFTTINSSPSISITDCVDLVATDYVEIYFYTTYTGNTTVYGASGPTQCWFDVHRIN
jgi:hypothetical protein